MKTTYVSIVTRKKKRKRKKEKEQNHGSEKGINPSSRGHRLHNREMEQQRDESS